VLRLYGWPFGSLGFGEATTPPLPISLTAALVYSLSRFMKKVIFPFEGEFELANLRSSSYLSLLALVI